MKVLLLSPYPEKLIAGLAVWGDDYVVTMEKPELWPQADYVVSFGYNHIIKEPYLTQYRDRLINIHISYLPWNRGADPNFWSWFDGTPRGVTIHDIDAGLDTGPIIVRAEVTHRRPDDTLKSSYDFLHATAATLFFTAWSDIRVGRIAGVAGNAGEHGSAHKASDKDRYWNMLSDGWNTPVTEVEALGRRINANGKAG